MTERAFDLIQPARLSSGVVVSSPHSGRDYGEDFLESSVLDAHTLRSSEDAWVDELVADAPALGVPVLAARAPRAYVDLNRSADELDPALIAGIRRGLHNPRVTSGLGVIPRVVANGRAIYRGRLGLVEAESRLGRYWHPYHEALQQLLEDQRIRFGSVVLLDCHSMPREAIEAHSPVAGPVPHVVLGDRFGASASGEVMACIERSFASAGLVVARNTPFAGAYITQHYGRPARGQHVVQIEIDRSLYMNEATLERHEGFAQMRGIVRQMLRDVIDLSAPQMPLAAE